MYLIQLRADGVPVTVHSDFERVDGAKITRERNAVSTLEFTMYPGSPGYDACMEFATTATVTNLRTGEVEFEGRVISCDPSHADDGLACKSVVCEDVAGYLNDSRQPYTEERLWEGGGERTGLQEFVDYVLDNHNKRMPEHKRVYRGTVDVPTFATVDNVTKGTNFERTLDLISDKLVGVFGGEWRVRRGDDGRLYLDYRTVLGSVSRTPIAIGHNIASAASAVDPNGLITRLYPRGCKLTKREVDGDGAEREVQTEERLGIAEANGGVDYIDDAEAVREYGVIEGTAEWDDVTDPLNLKTKAEKWLEDNNRLPMSTEVTALDLSAIGIDPDGFRLYDWYKVDDAPAGVSATLEIVHQVLDLNDPSASTFDLGEGTKTQSSVIKELEGLKGDVEYVASQSHSNAVNIANAVKYTMSAIEVAEDRIVSTVGEQIVEVKEGIEGQITLVESRVSTIEQTAESIRLSVTELTKSHDELSAKVELMPDQITSTVTTAYKAYVDGKMEAVNSQMSEIRQTADSISLKVTSLEAAYGTCATSASVAAKVASCAGFALHKGATVSIRFSYANTAYAPTLDVNGTGARRIYADYSNSEVVWDAGNTVTFVFSGMYWYIADCGSRSAITQLADRIELKVSKGELSSQLSVESGAITIRSNRFSWDSSYSSMTRYGALTCTSGTIGGFTITSSSIYNNRLTLNGNGLTLKHNYNNELMGTIGVNNIQGSQATNGLIFDLEPLGDYMCWAHRRTESQATYTMVLTYYANAYGSHSRDSIAIDATKLDVYCNTDFHNWSASNFYFDLNSGGPSQGINLIMPGGGLGVVRLNSADGSRYWDVHVKRGIIIS